MRTAKPNPFLVSASVHGADESRGYPFSIPAIRSLKTLKFHPHVTFFIGENGSGKSTLLEAIAIRMKFNAEGGGKNEGGREGDFSFSTHDSHSELHEYLTLEKSKDPPSDGYFLRAESFYNLSTQIENRGGLSRAYGGRSPHEQSHGEAFFNTMTQRFHGHGVYILDEPEAALSPSRQMSCLTVMHSLISRHSQFIIATHSPILMAYPDALIYEFSEKGIRKVDYEQTEHYAITREFLLRKDKMLKILLEDDESKNQKPKT